MSWVKRVEAVLGILQGSSISEIELGEGELEIILRRHSGTPATIQAHQPAQLITAVPLPQPAIPAPQPTPAATRTIEMKAPLTGVYYAAPTPTADPFVKVGDIIRLDQTVALIEAMKVFSEIQADVTGRVVAIKVQSGSVVKKGDVLLQVEPV
ncbi:acetyl-CoA carboxylase biotin carboxyl carrier protein [Dictyobacter formicarum]|uniref:Biotin carboxyl carrier protein of acetyl-CoA carboxylase n=1 Tax=Dictyobacter formicarum TaxID=2778368 RepID=A0ABQ3VUQ4_9CHLR|nr:biotin/lipoyl-containing protein [Dictyobacter formicarum]GHO89548.1 acetyl-CoA carboxylase, biotin carboxyl carrier protein [Dictyobacter formicarum]